MPIMTSYRPKLLDLFSGIGGFSLGLERAGFETVAFCETDSYCRAVLKKHWPNVPQYDDIRTLTADRLHADGISVDAICGGFPCQDISVAGTGAGIEGERSGLWSEYARVIGELRPAIVVVENVAALLGRGMGRVLGDLAALGFDAEWHCIPASAVGAPHRRDRVWVIAYPAQKRLRETGGFRRGESTQRVSSSGQTPVPTDLGQERIERLIRQEISRITEFSWCENVGRVEDLRDRSDLPSPIFRGARDGVPDWVDRVGALGNAVVPQIPEAIGRAIIKSLVHEMKDSQPT